MRIIVKEVDRLFSRKVGKNYISEYLIYLSVDGVNIKCFNEYGENAKTQCIKKMLEDLGQDESSTIIQKITLYKQ